MSLTNAQLKALSFGYLNGGDLMKYCSPQLLIKQYEIDPTSLQESCDTAIAEVSAHLSTRFDLTAELAKLSDASPDTRMTLFVKIAAIFADRNAIGNIQNLSDSTLAMFTWADKTVRDIRNGQMGLPVAQSSDEMTSGSEIVGSSFLTLG